MAGSDGDRTVVARLKACDRETMREVYERHHGAVLALATAMLGRSDGAWDVVQDVFVSFARCARKLEPDTDLRKYLLAAGANRARDMMSRRRNPGLRYEQGAAAETSVPAPEALDPAAIAESKEEATRLWNSLFALPDEQRTVVALHTHAGLTFREIAALEGISENTAMSRYRYALQDIRRRLREVSHE